jgi:hypothetical protein
MLADHVLMTHLQHFAAQPQPKPQPQMQQRYLIELQGTLRLIGKMHYNSEFAEGLSHTRDIGKAHHTRLTPRVSPQVH